MLIVLETDGWIGPNVCMKVRNKTFEKWKWNEGESSRLSFSKDAQLFQRSSSQYRVKQSTMNDYNNLKTLGKALPIIDFAEGFSTRVISKRRVAYAEIDSFKKEFLIGFVLGILMGCSKKTFPQS